MIAAYNEGNHVDRFASKEFLLFVADAITSKPLDVITVHYDEYKVVEDWLLTHRGKVN